MKILLLLTSLMLPSVAFADGPFADLTFEEACEEAKDAMAGVKPSDRLRDQLAEEPDSLTIKMKLASALARDGENEEALELASYTSRY